MKTKHGLRPLPKTIPLRRISKTAGQLRIARPSCERGAVNVSIIQPALQVGAANDPLEHEAHKTADKIVSMPAPETPLSAGTAPAGRNADNVIPMAQRAGMDDRLSVQLQDVRPFRGLKTEQGVIQRHI